MAKTLFDAYDRARLQDTLALLDRGLAEQRAGALPDAVADFDRVLARQPLLERRVEIAPAYVAFAESLEESDRVRALGYLRRALRLDPAGPASSHARSELSYLEGEDLLARGITDLVPFEQALALDPANHRAHGRLDQLRAQAQATQLADRRIAAVVAGLLLTLVAAVALVARGRT
jgi:tetratricopeptide (TPR) repeat protein